MRNTVYQEYMDSVHHNNRMASVRPVRLSLPVRVCAEDDTQAQREALYGVNYAIDAAEI